MDTDESILELNSIPCKGFETNLQSEESYALLPLSDISDSVEDEEKKNHNDIPDDQLRRETEERSHLQLNMGIETQVFNVQTLFPSDLVKNN